MYACGSGIWSGLVLLDFVEATFMAGTVRVFYAVYGDVAKERRWKSYLDGVGKAGRICFSLPILASVLCYMGGWI